jgi:signal transduction histidine kinase
LAKRYAAALRRYAEEEQESVLAEAYELGREAVTARIGVLDIACVHQQAFRSLLPAKRQDHDSRVRRSADAFFLELLSPFELAHRGFRETSVRLQQMISALEARNRELADANRNLAAEIDERKRAEAALRVSERHYQRLFNEARTMQERLRNLSNRALHVQEEERRRISRELHDEVGQAMTAISMSLELLKHDGIEVATFRQRIADAQSQLGETMEIIHRFARELRPAMLDELGLLPALRSCLKGFAERTGLRVQFRGDAMAEELGSEQKITLFRVAQESLTNVAKHARARRVDICIRRIGREIHMEVADDGRSFRPERHRFNSKRKGLGLLGMQERVRLVRGQLTISPQPNRGTMVRVVLPCRNPRPSDHARRERGSRNGTELPLKPVPDR